MKINWGTAIVLFFAMFISLMVTFVVFSLKQNTDLVADDYYQQGADYTSRMEINKRSLAYTDSISIESTNDHIEVNLKGSLASTVDSMHVYFFRPSDKRHDYSIDLAPNKGNLQIDQKKLLHGRYQVRLSWKMDQQQYLVTKDLEVK